MFIDYTNLLSYGYPLPQELIAQVPAAVRDESRLMVIQRESSHIAHRRFRDIVDYLPENSVLVLNNTKVIPARLYGQKPTGGKLEILLLHPLAGDSWEAMIKGKIKPGTPFIIDNKLKGEVLGVTSSGRWKIRLEYKGSFNQILAKIGHTPLPPYIKREQGQDDRHDRERYQTVYAEAEGAVAAPTAGLHFTRKLLEKLQQREVQIVYLTLHVGPGTFLPVREEDIRKHPMESEYYDIPPETAAAINKARQENRQIMVVGTSTLRALESAQNKAGLIEAKSGYADIFIYPGYIFCSTYSLLTNLHLPKSTNLVLVAAFAGYELTMRAYREAVAHKYRFYSYGDATLIV